MCIYPRLIKNPKYKTTKKNGGIIPPVLDERTKYVPIGCGNCIECRKQKAQQWKVRLHEEIKTEKNAKFITLTFSNESIKKLIEENKKLQEIEGYELDNEIATKAIRLFLERWRKKYKKSLKHWLVTELGHNGTENIHLHGIIWTKETYETIHKIWNYGFIWPRPESTQKTYVNHKTVNYTVKYVNKVDKNHPTYKSRILTSPGIGANYINTAQAKYNKFNNEKTKTTYKTNTGHEINLPIYYRNKIYSETQREQLWIQKLNENIRYIMGQKIKADDIKEIQRTLKHYQKINKELGYGTDEKNWQQEQYEIQQRIINYEKRIQNAKKKYK